VPATKKSRPSTDDLRGRRTISADSCAHVNITVYVSAGDSLAGVYTIDDGEDVTATTLNPYSTDVVSLREQVVSLEETHSFSASVLNLARVGYSRAGYFFTGEPTPGTPAVDVPGFYRRASGWCCRCERQRGVQSARSVWQAATTEATCGSRAIFSGKSGALQGGINPPLVPGSSLSSPTKHSRSASTGRLPSPACKLSCWEPRPR